MRISELNIPQSVKDLFLEGGYDELYPPQADAIAMDVLDGRNLVLATPTASGKTLIAQLCILKHLIERGGKALYLVPLRALASEKFEEFRNYSHLQKNSGHKIRVAISTGDFDSSDHWLGRYDIIFATNEKADSLLRHKASWIGELTIVVIDEVHLLTDPSRGPTLEVVITRLKQLNPHLQFLALSATVENADEVAKWLDAAPISNDWRPIPLREGVYCAEEILFKDAPSRRIESHIGYSAVDIALDSVINGGQALIFTETRRSAVEIGKRASAALKSRLGQKLRIAERIAEKILESGEKTRLSEQLADQVRWGSGFHHAGLNGIHRKIIELSFKKGRIKILAATPTLAAGVNLPARAAIISSYERYEPGYGRYPISVLEYKQFCGRAGRPRYDSYGEAVLIARTKDEQDFLLEKYVLARPEKLWSKLAVEKILRPHVLSTIAMGFASSEEGLREFFSQTFYANQYGPKPINTKVSRILGYLYSEGMVDIHGRSIIATDFGRRVSELYIDPESAVIIRDGIDLCSGVPSNIGLLHLAARTPDLAPKLYPRRRESEELSLFVEDKRDEFIFAVPEIDLDYAEYEEFLAEAKSARIILSWIDEISENEILEKYHVEPGDLLRLVDLMDWLLYAIEELANLFQRSDFLKPIKNLRVRVQSGVRQELIPLVQLKGIGRVRARALFNSGFKRIQDLKKASLTEIMTVPTIGPTLSKSIKEQVGGIIHKDEWEKLKNIEDSEKEQKLISEYP
ncbi:DEAD/DEAH box helicase [[Eubacterium] cellulosolvens]